MKTPARLKHLTSRQSVLADAIGHFLVGEDREDALAALLSISAGVISANTASDDDAALLAAVFGQSVVRTVCADRAGLIEGINIVVGTVQ
ncbi:hypothetical protein [Nitratireductor soli]|uniref:hypothetical protein n=1 Tax=Nitratireductor soli TaxID=1670619 RepID=UPI00065E6CBD|nr:hypothetical protein [Nitratireductor soli]